MKSWVVIGLLGAATALGLAQGLPPGDGPRTITGTVLEPTPLPFKDEFLKRLKVPAGFEIKVFARNLDNARWMQVMPNGDIYLSRRAQGDILLLRDKNRDGVVDGRSTVAQNIKYAHGLATRNGLLYIYADKFVYTARIRPDGTLGKPQAIISDLPDSGQHTARTIGFGPDGMMYLSVGSTCNNCQESNPENATVVRAMPDGTGRNVYARGLRHTIGFGWHPLTKQFWGFDHGSDWRGDDQPPEELNRIQQNAHYGWPYCYASQQVDPAAYFDPSNTTKLAFCPTTEAPTLTYTAHAAPIGFVFYRGNPTTRASFPATFNNDGFVAMRGSWNRSAPSGYEVLRVRFNSQGQPTGFEPFVTGWLIPASETAGLVPAGSATSSTATNTAASSATATNTTTSSTAVSNTGVSSNTVTSSATTPAGRSATPSATGNTTSDPSNVGAQASTNAEREEAGRPAQFGRVAGLAVWTDGSLLIAEDQGGIIYRVIPTTRR
jgi:glucose/arabinose dehydrogenase